MYRVLLTLIVKIPCTKYILLLYTAELDKVCVAFCSKKLNDLVSVNIAT